MAILNVLDDGFVRLVRVDGSDLDIVRSARVSYNADWRVGTDRGSDHRLIHYLMEHGHTSPFESCGILLEVKAPIAMFRQWLRHRTQRPNEVSARYTSLDMGFYLPDEQDITTQDEKNRQCRTDIPHPRAAEFRERLRVVMADAYREYQELIADGCPRELARLALPVSTYSRMFTHVDLNNLFKFLRERLAPGAQLEIRRYARAVMSLAEPHFPVAFTAFRGTIPVEWCPDGEL